MSYPVLGSYAFRTVHLKNCSNFGVSSWFAKTENGNAAFWVQFTVISCFHNALPVLLLSNWLRLNLKLVRTQSSTFSKVSLQDN